MVSKLAVIAIVGILAVPILLGYAFNVEQVTETEYVASDDTVNVTPLLQNGVAYNYANADAYELNTRLGISGYNPIMPIFEKTSSVKTSLPWEQGKVSSFATGSQDLTTLKKYSIYLNYYTLATSNFKAEIYHNTTLLRTVTGINYLYYDHDSDSITYTYFTSGSNTSVVKINGGEYTNVVFTKISGSNITLDYAKQNLGTNTSFADIAAGFHFQGEPNNWWVRMPTNTKSVLFTIDLDSITDPNYSITIGSIMGNHVLTKTTTAGVVQWETHPYNDPTAIRPMYYDQNSTNNVYQIYMYCEKTSQDQNYKYYTKTTEFRYVGGWSDHIGYANYYKAITDTTRNSPRPISSPDIGVDYITFSDSSTNYSPKIRIDAAEFRAFEYQVIENQLYTPAEFKSNPATTIKDPVIYGSSITFGGNTYTVNDGNIRIGSHDVPVKNMVLSSVLTDNGYENRIGNTVVSTTLNPSTITFNGTWSASISTSSMETTTVTETEWQAGSFAWDGMDQNFLMVGLLASLGAFIALGIYARRSRASVWPLMIVCGGAALLFFIML